ncbi:MAG: M48 family metalloprotease, partial [Geodermatophilaceae bacterium]
MLLAVTLAPVTPLPSERVAAHGGWVIDPVPAVLTAALVSGLGAGTVRVVAVLRRRRVTRELRALCETCGVDQEELVVAPIAHPHAFAVPARFGRADYSGGRILVTVGMLRALDAAERRALLAHERAHLICRHHRQRAIVE